MKRRIALCQGDLTEEDVENLRRVLPSTWSILTKEEITDDYEGILFFGGDQIGQALPSFCPLVALGRSDCYPSVIPLLREALEERRSLFSSLQIPSSHLYMEAREWCREEAIPMEEKGTPLKMVLSLPYRELLEEGEKLLEKLIAGFPTRDSYIRVPSKEYPVSPTNYIVTPKEYVNRLSFTGFQIVQEEQKKVPSLLVTTVLEEALSTKARLVLFLSETVPPSILEERKILVAPSFLLNEELFCNSIKVYLEKGRRPSFKASLLAKKVMAAVLSLSRGESLNKEILAENLGVSSDYLERCFKKTYGIRLWNLVQQKRVEDAIQLLKEGKTLKECVLLGGFSSQSYLSRLFQRCRKVTPGTYLVKEPPL